MRTGIVIGIILLSASSAVQVRGFEGGYEWLELNTMPTQWLEVAVPIPVEHKKALEWDESMTLIVSFSAICLAGQTPIWTCKGDYYCVNNADIVAGRIPEDKLHKFPPSEEECRN